MSEQEHKAVLTDEQIGELKRLAESATPGPWTAKDTPGAGLEIYADVPLQLGMHSRQWPAFSTANADVKEKLVAYETWTQFPSEKLQNIQARNAAFIAAANPATILALIERIQGAQAAPSVSAEQTATQMTDDFDSRRPQAARTEETVAREAFAEMYGHKPDISGTDWDWRGFRRGWQARAAQAAPPASDDAKDVEQWRTTFYLQRKGCLPEWKDETPGHSRLEDSLACVKYCKSTTDRPLRILEIKQRTVMDQSAIDAAIAAQSKGGAA